jgi:hypothetical protein
MFRGDLLRGGQRAGAASGMKQAQAFGHRQMQNRVPCFAG